MVLSKTISLLLFALASTLTYAQQTYMLHYTTEDGIPGTEVFDVMQDKRGYIWMATNNGICKFNGKTFKSFYKNEGLPDNSVIEFIKDEEGKIWLTTYSNEFAYLNKDSVIPYKYNKLIQSYGITAGYAIESAIFHDDHLYIGWFANNIIKIDTLGNIDTLCQFNQPASELFCLSENKFIHSNKHQYYNNYKTKIHFKDTSFTIDPFFSKRVVRCPRSEYAKNKNTIAVSYGKYLFIIRNYRISNQTNFESEVTKLKFDNTGNLMVCTYSNGFYLYTDLEDFNKPACHFLGKNTVTSCYQDNLSGYWISTYENGIYYIPSTEYKYMNKSDGLSDEYIKLLEEENQILWFANSENNVGFIKGNEIKEFELSKFNNRKITVITHDNDKKVIWGGFDGGRKSLFLITKDYFKFFESEKIGKKIEGTGSNIKTLHVNKDLIITGGPSTSVVYDKNNLYGDYKIIPVSGHTIVKGKTRKELWIGNPDGLYHYQNDSTIYYGEKNRACKKRIIKLIYSENNDMLWAATKDSGIYMLRNDTLRFITKNEGLSENNVTALCAKGNKIWVGTTKGMDQITFSDFEKFTYDIQHFNENKGLISNIINAIEVMGNTVYIATNKGISYFDHTKVKKNLLRPPIYLTKIRINNKDTIIMNNYDLAFDQNNIQIEFDGLSYRAPDELMYLYKMEGLYKYWQTSFSNQIEFTLLPPGKYRCIVFAINEDGFKSKKPQIVTFNIKPPFYKTWWFISLIALFFVMINAAFFGILYRVRFREVKKRNKVEKQLIKERQKALGQQMNPHFIFNTLSSIQYYLYNNEGITASDYLEKFSFLMRNILYNSQKEFIPLKDEIISLTTYLELEQLRLDNKFEYTISVDENIDDYATKILPFLIQPYVENAIWHGIQHKKEKGIIKIDIKPIKDYLLCSIDDNGIGRKISEEINKKRRKSHTSLGGQITEKRLNLINALYHKKPEIRYIDKTDDKGFPTGTKVELTIPVFYE